MLPTDIVLNNTYRTKQGWEYRIVAHCGDEVDYEVMRGPDDLVGKVVSSRTDVFASRVIMRKQPKVLRGGLDAARC